MFRRLVAIAGTVTLMMGMAACSGAGSGSGAEPESAAGSGAESGADSNAGSESITDAVIIDVRTPAEYAEGHLDGAILLDLNGGQFEQELPNLDPQATYVVYCRSGNRSGQATALMTDAGFTSVSDLGSLQQAAESTGLQVVTGQ